MGNFVEKKREFDDKYKNTNLLDYSIVPVHGEIKEDISLYNDKGDRLEEYYKWQFIYSLIKSGLYSKDKIGVECYFPKGNKNSAPLKMDGCIFDSKEWIDYYLDWKENKNYNAIEWLSNHLIGVIEFKNEKGKQIREDYVNQVKPSLKVSEANYCIGFYYNRGKLYIFQKDLEGRILRYNDSRNEKGKESGINDLSFGLPDKYSIIPSYDKVVKETGKFEEIDIAERTIEDLEPITGINSNQINEAMTSILQAFDQVSLVNQRGYELLIQVLALKMFDEKQNEKSLNYSSPKTLDLYISDDTYMCNDITDKKVQNFIERIKQIYKEAKREYPSILRSSSIDWTNENHIRAVMTVVKKLQDYTFIRSIETTDLYQLVFYRFANKFTKVDKAQFVTPLQLIEFIVEIVNPREDDKIIDPTAGIADFLSVSYVKSDETLSDENLYGVDVDKQMIMLAQLNMLLNGDGNAVLEQQSGLGSILYKFNNQGELVALDPEYHSNGNWDNWVDGTELMKFDVVLTNPPFGENRKFEADTDTKKEIAGLYELWERARVNNWIDPGLLFLENAYQVLDTPGRMGIVLSNSITSIDRWKEAREWLMERMRIVALFDLPKEVFAETGGETSIVIAYKPDSKELERLKRNNYEIFVKEIENVGYEIRTKDRVKYYNEIYNIDDSTFEVMIDEKGEPIINEDFTETVKDFKEWALGQEETLKNLFLK